MANVCVVLVIGIPGAGKTTLCEIFAETTTAKYHVHHIAYDRLCSDFTKKSRLVVFETVRDLLGDIGNRRLVDEKPHLLLIDDNMYYHSMRKDYLNLARQNCVPAIVLYVSVPLEVAILQNEQRSGTARVPLSIITEMHSKFEAPHSGESVFIVDNGTSVTEKMNEFIDKALSDFQPYAQNVDVETKPICPSTLLQNADLVLRRCVRDHCMAKPQFSRGINEIRKDLLRACKLGAMPVNDVSQLEQEFNKRCLKYKDYAS